MVFQHHVNDIDNILKYFVKSIIQKTNDHDF